MKKKIDKKQISSSDTRYFRATERFWQFCLTLLLVDYFLIFNFIDYSISIDKLTILRLYYFSIILSIISFIILKTAFNKLNNFSYSSLQNKFFSRKRIINGLIVLLPIIILLLFSISFTKDFFNPNNLLPLIAAMIAFVAISSSFGKIFLSLITLNNNAPRNIFLNIDKYQKNKLIIFISTIFLAKISGFFVSLLYVNNYLTPYEFLAMQAFAFFVLIISNPKEQDFFDSCPSCRAKRCKSLNKLPRCTECYSRKFFV